MMSALTSDETESGSARSFSLDAADAAASSVGALFVESPIGRMARYMSEELDARIEHLHVLYPIDTGGYSPYPNIVLELTYE